jgi:hypothetical protein
MPGRILLHDDLSRNFPYPLKAPETGVSAIHRMDADHSDQWYTNGCVGFHGNNLLNSRAASKSRREFNWVITEKDRLATFLDHQDGLQNYSGSTEFDPFPWTFPPVDDGSSGLGLMKFWLFLKIIKEYQWTFSFPQFLAALQKQPVGVGTEWYSGMTEPDSKGIAHPTGIIQGGHQFVASGILWGSRYSIPSKRKIKFEQSWGEEIPFPTFYMYWEEIEWLIMQREGDVCVPIFL